MLKSRLSLVWSALALVAVVFSSDPAAAAAPEKARPRHKGAITNPKFDPEAEQVELFQGMKDGRLEVTVIAKDANGGNLLIENMTDKPLTVAMPHRPTV